jgi:transposase-like protein
MTEQRRVFTKEFKEQAVQLTDYWKQDPGKL